MILTAKPKYMNFPETVLMEIMKSVHLVGKTKGSYDNIKPSYS